jgi:phasin family protein
MLHRSREPGWPLSPVLTKRKVQTMPKTAKVAGEKIDDAAESIETVVKTGAEAFKNGFEKAAKGYDQLLGYSKETVDAYVKSANAAGKGVESLHGEIYAYSKQSIEDSIAAAKAVLAAKSVHEAFELQTDFAKTAFDTYVGEMTKLSEMFTAATKQTFEPLQGRVQAWVEVVQNARVG